MIKDEDLVLITNPFDGDFGTSDDRILKDKMVNARKARPCHDCGQQIQPGERIRTMTAVFDGELMNYSWCQLCCEAMEESFEDGGEAIEARLALRNKP